MAEITTLWNWNESSRFKDMSEIWSGIEGKGLRILDPPKGKDADNGYPAIIKIEHCTGYMVMPGIYYFKPPFPLMDDLRKYKKTRKTAVIFYNNGDSPLDYEIEYLAIDEENIEILKKIQKTRGAGSRIEELEIQRYDPNDLLWEYMFSQGEAFSCADSEGFSGGTAEESRLEDDVVELMPRIGLRNIRVGLKQIFMPRIEVAEYDYAYQLEMGNKLVLIKQVSDTIKDRQEYDLRMLEELTVRRTEEMCCGITWDKDYALIDCRTEKEKEMLTPEAYALFQKCRETMDLLEEEDGTIYG